MEAVSAVCPGAFAGATGGVLASAIGAMLAAHCAIGDPGQWPPDDADQLLDQENLEFDFIVVGAGTAGSLVANRLSQVREWKVLLIEAGNDPPADSQVPAFMLSLMKTEVDWNHLTEPNSKFCQSFKNNSCGWSHGKTIGGSSAMNAMLYVRGNKRDYDNWEKLGNPGWDYSSIMKHFRKFENLPEKYKNEPFWNDYGHEGELYLNKYNNSFPMKEIIKNAWEELGLYTNSELSENSQIGLTEVLGILNDGQRYSSAKAFLGIAKKRSNLYIIKKSVVTKVLIEPTTKHTLGVELRQKNNKVIQIKASKEVILSAGAINTPQILMLSGIGPAHHLHENNITTIVDLSVGENLQDHIILPLYFTIGKRIMQKLNQDTILNLSIDYIRNRTGPFSAIGITDMIGFIDTTRYENYPDLQFHHIFFSQEDKLILPAYIKAGGFDDEYTNEIIKINSKNELVTIFPTLLKPKSKGKILLRSKNPDDDPIIKPNYLSDERDIKILLRGIDFIKTIEKTDAFRKQKASLYFPNLKNCKKYDTRSEKYMRCYLKHTATTVYHPVGSVKMGPDTDSGAVVNHLLQVRGVKKLRVIDASIIPVITSGNTMAPTLAIAEKGASIVKQFWTFKEEL